MIVGDAMKIKRCGKCGQPEPKMKFEICRRCGGNLYEEVKRCLK